MVPKIYSPRFTSIGRTHSNSHLYSRSAIFYAKFSYLYTFFFKGNILILNLVLFTLVSLVCGLLCWQGRGMNGARGAPSSHQCPDRYLQFSVSFPASKDWWFPLPIPC